MYVSFPKLPGFTTEYEKDIEEVIKKCIEHEKEILYKHHVTEVEVVFAKECYPANNEKRLIKHRVIFRDETGVTPEFGFYQEDKKKITGLRLCKQLYGEILEAHGKIKKIEKKRVTTR